MSRPTTVICIGCSCWLTCTSHHNGTLVPGCRGRPSQQCPAQGRAARRRDLLHSPRGADRHRELAPALQCRPAACSPRLQGTGPRGVRASSRRMAGSATPTSSAGHATHGAPTNPELTLTPDHSSGADQGLPKAWQRIRATEPTIATLTPHVLRHAFASVADDLGYTEATIGAMLGHSGGGTTSRYIHKLDPALLAAADRVAGRIADLMAGKVDAGADVIELATAERRASVV